MDTTTFDRMVTDLLLMETSDGLDRIASELSHLHQSWARAGAPPESVEWVAGLVTDLSWWSGRLLGGLSFAHPPQELPDEDLRRPVS